MMKRSIFSRSVCRLAAMSLPLLALLPGCEPIQADVLQEFVTDFARSALAAWLL